MYQFEEVVFDLPEGREETEQSIEESFAGWWEYGTSETEQPITLEERISTLEDMFLMTMMEG